MTVASFRKTASVWGPPPTRLYRVLGLARDRGARRVAVVGASDGRFVLPFARSGMHTLAIDVDRVALWGGYKLFPGGPAPVAGLAARVRGEKLSEYVEIREMDLKYVRGPAVHDVVFTSGSLHYSRNHDVAIADLVRRLVSLAVPGGLIYIDFMMPVEPKHDHIDHYPCSGELPALLCKLGCSIRWARHGPLLRERGHVDNPVDHYHRLGYVLAERSARP